MIIGAEPSSGFVDEPEKYEYLAISISYSY